MMTTADEFGGRAGSEPSPERTSETLPSSVLRPGDVVAGRYRVEHEIGRGGMGIVYASTQLSTGRSVALKWLFESSANRGERRRRFLREARAASTIEHPSVVRVFDAGEHERGVFLAMELLRGESLRVYLQRHNLSAQDAIDLLMPALRGIAAAHAKGVIHRDLKPDNLLVCASDAGQTAIKVLDFGLSKLMAGHSDSLHTLPGAMLGTPQYMAPEQIESSGRVDARCDLYSIAAILYEAIAGRRPFEALTLADLLAKLARDEPPDLRQVAKALGKDVPAKLSRVVMRALHRDPARRQDSIGDFALELEPFGTARFHSAPAPRPELARTLREQERDASRPKRALVRNGTALALVLIALGLGWLALRMLSTREAQQTAFEALPIAKPAEPSAAPAPLPASARSDEAKAAPPVTRDPAIAPARSADSDAAPIQKHRARKAAQPPRRAARKPSAAPRPQKATRRSDLADPWE